MSQVPNSAATDLVRWSFEINPDHRKAIEAHLDELGADVLVRDGVVFIVTWDEPEGDLSEIIEAIWALNGEPFDVTEETFHRLALQTIHYDSDGSGAQAA